MSRWNWDFVTRRASTWLGVLSAMQGGAAWAFSAAPHEWREAFPDWLGIALLSGTMITGALVPVATSYKQRPFGMPSAPRGPRGDGDAR